MLILIKVSVAIQLCGISLSSWGTASARCFKAPILSQIFFPPPPLLVLDALRCNDLHVDVAGSQATHALAQPLCRPPTKIAPLKLKTHKDCPDLGRGGSTSRESSKPGRPRKNLLKSPSLRWHPPAPRDLLEGSSHPMACTRYSCMWSRAQRRWRPSTGRRASHRKHSLQRKQFCDAN